MSNPALTALQLRDTVQQRALAETRRALAASGGLGPYLEYRERLLPRHLVRLRDQANRLYVLAGYTAVRFPDFPKSNDGPRGWVTVPPKDPVEAYDPPLSDPSLTSRVYAAARAVESRARAALREYRAGLKVVRSTVSAPAAPPVAAPIVAPLLLPAPPHVLLLAPPAPVPDTRSLRALLRHLRALIARPLVHIWTDGGAWCIGERWLHHRVYLTPTQVIITSRHQRYTYHLALTTAELDGLLKRVRRRYQNSELRRLLTDLRAELTLLPGRLALAYRAPERSTTIGQVEPGGWQPRITCLSMVDRTKLQAYLPGHLYIRGRSPAWAREYGVAIFDHQTLHQLLEPLIEAHNAALAVAIS